MLKNMINKVRRWVSLLFGKSKEIDEIINTKIVSKEYYDNLEKYKQIYAGYYKDWHEIKYTAADGNSYKREMKKLNMAKVSSEYLSKILFSEKVEINVNDKDLNEYIEEVLTANRFYKQFQHKLEIMAALGGLILKVFPEKTDDGYELSISYITPDCFIPTAYKNGVVTEGVFLNITRENKKIYYLFEAHSWGKEKNKETGEIEKAYIVTNTLFEENTDKEDGKVKEVPLDTLYSKLEKRVVIRRLKQKLFQYIKPNIANNKDLQSPMGIPIYANSLDTLLTIDQAFDSLHSEFKLGRRRIIVPHTAIKYINDPMTGEMTRYFDASDEVYQAMNLGVDIDKQKIHDNTVSLRVEEHIRGINGLLNIYATQTGFSSGTFIFDGQSVKTATEVVSEQSSTYQTKESNENLIEEHLKEFINTIIEVSSLYKIIPAVEKEVEIDFYWDDSIIQDRDSDAEFYLKLKREDLLSKRFILEKVLKLTEEQIDLIFKQMKEESTSVNHDFNEMSQLFKDIYGEREKVETPKGRVVENESGEDE